MVIAVIGYGDLFVLPARRAEEGEEGCGLSDTGPLWVFVGYLETSAIIYNIFLQGNYSVFLTPDLQINLERTHI